MTWTPFDARFQDILTRMSRHRVLLEAEISVVSAWKIKEIGKSTNLTQKKVREMEKGLKAEKHLAEEERKRFAESRKKLKEISGQNETLMEFLEAQKES